MDWPVFVVQWPHVLLAVMWFGNLGAGGRHHPGAQSTCRWFVSRRSAHSSVSVGCGSSTSSVPLSSSSGSYAGRCSGRSRMPRHSSGRPTASRSCSPSSWRSPRSSGGRYVIVPATRTLATAPVAPDGSPTPELDAALERAKRDVLELIGFFVIFTCAIRCASGCRRAHGIEPLS